MYKKCHWKSDYILCSPLSSFSKSVLRNSSTSHSPLKLRRSGQGLQDSWDTHLRQGAKWREGLKGWVATSLTRSFRHNERDLCQKNSSGYYVDAIKRNDSYLIARWWDLNKLKECGWTQTKWAETNNWMLR
jgi:hypothetical protein